MTEVASELAATAKCKLPAAPGSGRRLKIVLYNPQAVFFTMPLALLAIGSELDPQTYEVVTIDGRLEADAVSAVLSHIDGAVCLGVTVLTGAPLSDALRISRAMARLGRICRWSGAVGIRRCFPANALPSLPLMSLCAHRGRRHSRRS